MKPSKARSLRVLNAEKAAKAFKAKTGVDVSQVFDHGPTRLTKAEKRAREWNKHRIPRVAGRMVG